MTSSSRHASPFVSVVIPVYADPDGLRTTLESIVEQQYSPFEVIIAITPSSGDTLEIAKEYRSKYSERIHIVEVRENGRARARNAGIQKANGEIIAFIDADIWVKPDWLQTAISDLKTQKADYLACEVISFPTTDDSGFIEKYDQALSIPVNHYVKEYNFAPTAALLITRDVIEDVGVFDPELSSGEDREFGNRVYRQGYELHVCDTKVYHPPRRKIVEQIQKAVRIGIGIEQLRVRYPDYYSFPSLLSPLSYAPPSPRRLKSRMSSNNYNPDFTEWILFYLLNYALKLYQQLGRWKAFCRIRS